MTRGRAYADTLDLALFEAPFCFGRQEFRMRGTAVPRAPAKQFFDAGAPQAHTLLALLGEAAPSPVGPSHSTGGSSGTETRTYRSPYGPDPRVVRQDVGMPERNR